MNSLTMQIRGGVERDSSGRKAWKGPLVKDEHTPCLSTVQDTMLFVFGCATQSEPNENPGWWNCSSVSGLFDMQGGKPGCATGDWFVCPVITRWRASVSDVHAIVQEET